MLFCGRPASLTSTARRPGDPPYEAASLHKSARRHDGMAIGGARAAGRPWTTDRRTHPVYRNRCGIETLRGGASAGAPGAGLGGRTRPWIRDPVLEWTA